MYAAVAVAERKRYLATYVVNHWRGALCRRAYCSCRLVNATLTQRHRVRRLPSLRLHLTLPTPSLRLATTSTATAWQLSSDAPLSACSSCSSRSIFCVKSPAMASALGASTFEATAAAVIPQKDQSAAA